MYVDVNATNIVHTKRSLTAFMNENSFPKENTITSVPLKTTSSVGGRVMHNILLIYKYFAKEIDTEHC